jgi:type III pantothenate kinase
MLLAVDIGNSSIKFGVFKNKNLIHHFTLESSIKNSCKDYLNQITKNLTISSFNKIIICSVVNDLTEIIAQSLQKLSQKSIIIIDQKSKIDLPIKIDPKINKNEVGKDRLMTSLAAYKEFGGNLAITDLGTATTIDVINNSGQYQGGAICAGINLTLKTLFQSTSLLPEIKIKKQNNIIGKNTFEAINSGIYFGHALMIENMVKKMSNEHGEKLQIILTGGYCEIMQKLIPNAKISQHLALYGISLIK